MAGGWARDGAVNDQIEASIAEELERLRARANRPAGDGPAGESAEDCAECGGPTPEARRKALAGVKLCIDCQERDRALRARPGINRRGSKDSQLK